MIYELLCLTKELSEQTRAIPVLPFSELQYATVHIKDNSFNALVVNGQFIYAVAGFEAVPFSVKEITSISVGHPMPRDFTTKRYKRIRELGFDIRCSYLPGSYLTPTTCELA